MVSVTVAEAPLWKEQNTRVLQEGQVQLFMIGAEWGGERRPDSSGCNRTLQEFPRSDPLTVPLYQHTAKEACHCKMSLFLSSLPLCAPRALRLEHRQTELHTKPPCLRVVKASDLRSMQEGLTRWSTAGIWSDALFSLFVQVLFMRARRISSCPRWPSSLIRSMTFETLITA